MIVYNRMPNRYGALNRSFWKWNHMGGVVIEVMRRVHPRKPDQTAKP